jgi:hypothetical protein
VSHPNQLALAQAADRWVEQSQALPDDVAIGRLTDKIATLQDAVQEMSLASIEDREPHEWLAGLSAIDIMAAQSKLVVERNVRQRFAVMGIAA